MSIPISFKRGSSVALSGVNPLFLAGELVYETDTFKFKIGDGTNSYNDLPFAFSGFYQPSGNYSVVGHTHTSSDISDFNNSVSGLLSKTIGFFTPFMNQPPSTNYATIDTRNSILVLNFDDGGNNESAIFLGAIPDGISTASGIYVNIYWTATTATSGQCRWGVAFEKLDGDVDTDNFDTATEEHDTVDNTNGIPTKTTILCTNIDNLIANDIFRLKIYRDSSDTTNDTLVGDVELIAVELQTVN